MNPLEKQVGGEHYKKLETQPIEFITSLNLDFCLGNVVKYLVRNKGKRREDLEKAYHYIELSRERDVSPIVSKMITEHIRDVPFFKQFKYGKKYAQVVGYAVVGNKAKAKELLRKFINKGNYSEV